MWNHVVSPLRDWYAVCTNCQGGKNDLLVLQLWRQVFKSLATCFLCDFGQVTRAQILKGIYKVFETSGKWVPQYCYDLACSIFILYFICLFVLWG